MTKLFISRSLVKDSPIRKVCEAHQISCIDESLLKFDALPFDSYPTTDWIFFYSKNGVKFFFEQINEPVSVDTKIGVMGQPTGNSIRPFANIEIDFIGVGDPVMVTEQFQKVVTGKSVLFVKAKFSRSSIDRNLHDVDIRELIVYDNTVREDFKLIHDPSILIFTSPMNADAYLNRYVIDEKATVIAIGPTTAKALERRNVLNVKIAAYPTEASMAEKLCGLLDDSIGH